MTNNINHLKAIVDQAWVKHSNDRLHLRSPTAQDMEILIKTCLMPLALKTQNDSFTFVHELKQEMHADLKYVESLKDDIDELESDKAEFSKHKTAREAELKKQRVFNTGNGVAKPVWNNANRGNHANHFVPRPVQLNVVRSNVNTGRENVNTGRANVNTVRANVNSVRQNVNSVRTNINTVRSKQPDHPLKNMVDRGIFDSGCSGHMTGNKDQLEDFEEFNGGSVTFGGSKGYISGKGKIRVGNLDFDSVSFVKELGHFNLFSISQICDKQHKVLFTETECLVVSSDFKMPDENQILLKVPRHHNMYSFDMKTPTPAKGFACLIAKATSDESKLWHRRLGHINFKNLNKLVKGNLVRGLPSKVFKNDHTCVACHKGKQHRASCKAKLERLITEPLHTLHMDLFGPTSVKSINHASYCLVITDDCTRFSWVFFLASKDETSGILQNFIRQIENQLSHRVKIIRSDNGTEFKNRDMLEFCGNKGIKQEYSNARTPQQNGVAERMNRTLIEAARTMLADSLLPTTFWAEAVSTACYIFNRVRVTKPQNKTPYELLFGHKPIISYIRPFGCHVTILDTLSVLGKFDGKSDEGFLVGYSLNSKAYRVYNLVTKRVEVNLHVNFLEDKPNVKGVGYRWMFDIDYLTDSMNYIPVSLENQANPHAGASKVTNNAGTSQTLYSNASKERDEDVELIVVPSTKASSTNTSEDNPKILAFRRELEEIALKHLGKVSENTSTSTPSVNTGSESVNTGSFDPDDSPMLELEIFYKSETGIFNEASYDEEGMITDFNSLPIEIKVSPTPTLRIHNIHPKSQILGDPKSVVQIRSKEEPKKISEALQDDSWLQAMQEELLQFKLQQVWVLVDLPHGMKVIGTKWVYRNKRNERGVVVRNKARLVAQGYTQEEGIDYDEVFALVTRIEAISHDRSLPKTSHSQLCGREFFAEIVDFLRGSNLRYALTSNPTIYDSLVKQFWQTATANTLADGTLELHATIDTIVVDSLEKDLKQTKLTMGSAIVKLVKKVKKAGGTKFRIDKGRRYKRRKETKGKKVVTSLDFQEEVSTGRLGGKEKAPMIIKEAPKKTKEQILQEETSLAEAIRLDTLEKEEEAKQVHLDSLLAQRIAEEEELNKQQKQRRAQSVYRVCRKWLTWWKSLQKKMVGTSKFKGRTFAEERARAKRNKPMTQSQLRTYMMNYLKNQGTWKLSQLKNLSFEEVKEEFDKLSSWCFFPCLRRCLLVLCLLCRDEKDYHKVFFTSSKLKFLQLVEDSFYVPLILQVILIISCSQL
ncbi:putative ribonuclease H-like domain-containing protein [Tanacetum coccineum]